MYYWVKPDVGKEGCVVGKKQDAENFGTILGTLPYPAHPVLGRFPNEDGVLDRCPDFCFNKKGECLNRSSCPRNYACTE